VNKRVRNLLQVATVLAIAAALWRFFPIAVEFAEGAALSIRRFWWLILLVLLAGWSAWVLSKRNRY
jgi:hypothetical protein